MVWKVIEGEIGGALYAEICTGCSAKVKSDDDTVAEYTKCGMMTRVNLNQFVQVRD